MYGKCISANYQNVKKDMCAKEFLALKDCYLVSVPQMLEKCLAPTDQCTTESGRSKILRFLRIGALVVEIRTMPVPLC